MANGKACVVILGSAALAAALPSRAGAPAEAESPPPAARAEGIPPPRAGYVWAAGYWDWTGHAYSWTSGHYIFERRGAHWVPDRWDQLDSHWQHVAGHWER
jgi:WXXGXW repeat (2 copies)